MGLLHNIVELCGVVFRLGLIEVILIKISIFLTVSEGHEFLQGLTGDWSSP